MADNVEDDDIYLYGARDSSADINRGQRESEQISGKQSDDLSQIFDNQIICDQPSDDFRHLFDVSNPTQEPNSSQNLDQSMDNIEDVKDFVVNDKDLSTDINDNNDSEDDDDEDDDDDDVQVTIGDIKANTSTFPYGSAPMNLNITKRSANFVSGQTSAANKQKPGLDIDAIGTINGVSIYDVNLDSLEEKPWRKPGADITDYFNYGFNEEMWKLYCERQKKLRSHDFLSNGPPQTVKPVPTFSGTPPVVPGVGKPGSEQIIPIASVNENSKYTGLGPTKKAGPPPGRKQSGTIDVIGGGTPTTPSMLPSRRPPDTKENFIQVIGNRPPGPPPPPGLPPGLPFPPPPGMSMPPPFGFPPPGVEFPPGMPPPGMPLIAPNGQPLPFPPGEFPPMRFPHPGMVPHQEHHFDEQSEGFHEGMRGSPNDNRDEDRERDRDRDRERDYHRSSRGYSREYRDDESYRSGRSNHYRERDYEHHERSRDREEYESRRHRERDNKEREREKTDSHRDRDRETRDSSRRRGHRDEHEEDNRSSSSRHKHSKRSKRDKEEEEKETKH